MKNFLPILKKNFFLVLLVLITLLVCILNYKPGSWLSGWDTLHPEFNFPLNFKRLFFGVWREEQGLGTIAGHSHMSDLPRVIILWLFSLVFPTNVLRYFYIFLCLILGPLGVYFFVKYTSEEPWLRKLGLPPSEVRLGSISEELFCKSSKVSMAAFLGGLFYLFNLGTLQHFYVPFEMFCVQYAALGWLFLSATKFLYKGKKENLIFFSLFTFLAAPQAYAATLFYVYFILLTVYLFTLFFVYKKPLFFKKSFLLLLITFLVNSFWLLPNLYFLKTNAENVPNAQINLLFSEEAFLRNKKFGTVLDTAILKNFLFDWKKVENGTFVNLLEKWIIYLKQPGILVVGYLSYLFIILGIFSSLIKKKKEFIALLPVFLVSTFFIVGMNFPFAPIYIFLQNSFSFLKEALRMPFTKFSLVLMLVYAVFFAFGNNFLLEKISRRLPKIRFLYVILWIVLFVIFCWPFFKGELISSAMRVRIPDEYFQTFNYFNTQNNLGRIANFPSPVYSGWEYYDWGFQGAGFFWFGQKMALLNRDFDRWNPANENYYYEVSYALYSQNLILFEKILEKYQINWLLVDGNIVSYTSPKSLYFDQLESLIENSDKIKIATSFGKIKIYQVLLSTKPKDFVFLAQDLPKVGPIYQWNNFDQAFVDGGYYFSSPATSHQPPVTTYYPFRSLFTGRRQEELEFNVEEDESEIIFKAKIPKELVGGKLVIPEISEPEVLEINSQDLAKTKILEARVYLDGESIQMATNSMSIKLNYIKNGVLEIKVPKAKGIYSYNSDLDSKKFLEAKPQSCDAFNKGLFGLDKFDEDNKTGLNFSALDQASCLDLYLPDLENKYAYLVNVEARYKEGKSLLFWLENLQSRKADIETYLPKDYQITDSFFIQPPMASDGIGYSLHFNNVSIGQVKSVNDLFKVTVYPIPYKLLTELKIVKNQPSAVSNQSSVNIEVEHPNEGFYSVKLANLAPNSYLILSQSYSKDWLAFQKTGKFTFKKLDNHVLVNNWENGWQLPITNNPARQAPLSGAGRQPPATNHQSPITIYLFFWPQLLEYLGFGLLLITPFLIRRLALDKQNTEVL